MAAVGANPPGAFVLPSVSTILATKSCSSVDDALTSVLPNVEPETSLAAEPPQTGVYTKACDTAEDADS